MTKKKAPPTSFDVLVSYSGLVVKIPPRIYTEGDHHPIDRHKTGIAKPIKIEHNVWVGGHCVIVGGITISDTSIIAACSVVTKDVLENTILIQ